MATSDFRNTIEALHAYTDTQSKGHNVRFIPNFHQPVQNSGDVVEMSVRDSVPSRVFRAFRRNHENPYCEYIQKEMFDPESLEEGFKTQVKKKVLGDSGYYSSKKPFESFKRIATCYYGKPSVEAKDIVGARGFAQYLYACWAKEDGVILNPGILHFTVAREYALEVQRDPDTYRSIFTKSSAGKENLLIEEPHITPEVILRALEEVVPNKNFLNCIAKTKFPSDLPGQSEVMAAVFASASTPYYNFMKTLCGIKQVAVEGSRTEWMVLVDTWLKILKMTPKGSYLVGYIETVISIFREIIYHSFDVDTSDQKLRQNAETFFSGMFWSSKTCDSGSEYALEGWFKKLYFNPKFEKQGYGGRKYMSGMFPGRDEYISGYPSHSSYVSWEVVETGRCYARISGIFHCYRVRKNNMTFLIPRYGWRTYTIEDSETFKKLRDGL